MVEEAEVESFPCRGPLRMMMAVAMAKAPNAMAAEPMMMDCGRDVAPGLESVLGSVFEEEGDRSGIIESNRRLECE